MPRSPLPSALPKVLRIDRKPPHPAMHLHRRLPPRARDRGGGPAVFPQAGDEGDPEALVLVGETVDPRWGRFGGRAGVREARKVLGVERMAAGEDERGLEPLFE